MSGLARVGIGALIVVLLTLLGGIGGSPRRSAAAAIGDHWLLNVTGSAFAIAWTTDVATTGAIRYRPQGATTWSTAADPRGQSVRSRVHFVVAADGLAEQTAYEYDLIVDDVVDDNGGRHYAVTTGPVLRPAPPSSTVVQITSADGTDLGDVVVRAVVVSADGSRRSAPLGRLVQRNATGQWYLTLALADARQPDLQDAFPVTSGDHLLLDARSATGASGSTEIAIPPEGTIGTFVLTPPPTAAPTATGTPTATASPAPSSTPPPTSTPTATPTAGPTATTVTAAGGTLTTNNGTVQVIVPAGALPAGIDAVQLTDRPVADRVATPPGTVELLAFSIEAAPAITFTQDVLIRVARLPDDRRGVDPSTLVVYRLTSTGASEALATTVDPVSGVVTARARRVGTFVVAGRYRTLFPWLAIPGG